MPPTQPWLFPIGALRKELRSCTSADPTLLRQQLNGIAPRLKVGILALTPTLQADANRTPNSLLSILEGPAGGAPTIFMELLTDAFRLLRRSLPLNTGSSSSSSSGRSSTSGRPSAAHTPEPEQGVNSLLYLIIACMIGADAHLLRAISKGATPGQLAAANRGLRGLAECHPCSMLAPLLLPCDGEPGPLLLPALRAAILLLVLVCRAGPPLSDALLSDASDLQLLPRLCTSVVTQLGIPDQAAHIAFTASMIARACNLMSSYSAAASGASLARHAQRSLELGSCLLALIAHLGAAASPASLHWREVKDALGGVRWWFEAQRTFDEWWPPSTAAAASSSDGGGASLTSPSQSSSGTAGSAAAPAVSAAAPAAFSTVGGLSTEVVLQDQSTGAHQAATPRRVVLTSQHIGAIVSLAPLHIEVTRRAVDLVTELWQHLSDRERGRAFTATAVWGHSLVAGAAVALTPASAGADSGFGSVQRLNSVPGRSGAASSSPAASAVVVRMMSGADSDVVHTVAGGALRLLLSFAVPPDELSVAGTYDASLHWAGLRTRGQWLLRSGALAAAEALLRASSPGYQGIADSTTDLAVTVVALLQNDPLLPVAVAALLSIVASLRKRVLSLMLTARDVRRAGAPAAAGASGNQRPHEGIDPEQSARLTSMKMLSGVLGHALLKSQCERGSETMLLVLRCCLLQLLPLAVHTTSAYLRDKPFEPTGLAYASLLAIVAAANAAGMADFTAATGAPRLLHQLLTAAESYPIRSSSVRQVLHRNADITITATAALIAAGGDPTWRAAAGRLQLVGLANACLRKICSPTVAAYGLEARWGGRFELRSAAPALAARLFPSATAIDAPALRQALADAYPTEAAYEGQVVELAANRTLEDCMLAAAAVDGPGGNLGAGQRLLPFFGCWNRRCLNLSGGSEAALKTKTCAGCRHARYCSDACQRMAWRSGHRAACQARQQQEAAAKGGV